MKKLFVLFCILFVVCSMLFAVIYAEGKTLDVYPDTMLSGSKFAIQFDPNKKTVTLTNYGSAKTFMTMGDKTGTTEVKIGANGSLDYDSMVKLFESNTEIYLILAADKNFVAKATVSNIDNKDFSARLSKVGSAEYIVGGFGPAGGIVFYDKGEYSDGWRYLEAAPSDIRIVAGTPSVDKSDPWYDFGEEYCQFGCSVSGNNYVEVGTKSAIGEGKNNTKALVDLMGNSAYVYGKGKETVDVYAAKLCSDLIFNGFDDWFLPSIDELDLMYTNLKKNNLGDFVSDGYWSSTEIDSVNAYRKRFDNGGLDVGKDALYRVRPIRSF